MKSKKINIAILGANSHIAKGLISHFYNDINVRLVLFARSKAKVRNFLKLIKCKTNPLVLSFDKLNKETYDVIINCVGVSAPSEIRKLGSEIFKLTESFDNQCIDYLNSHNNTIYINFSSGAVYGKNFDEPAELNSGSFININKISTNDYYSITKIYSEAKHRSLTKFNIIDLRVFNYFSRYLDLTSNFFITELIQCVRNNTVFGTSREDNVRDYVHPEDLYRVVRLCIDKKYLNDVFDVYSLKPVTKFEVLDYFKRNYNLQYNFVKNPETVNATGNKHSYYSNNKRAEEIGYKPRYDSLTTIQNEVKYIIG